MKGYVMKATEKEAKPVFKDHCGHGIENFLGTIKDDKGRKYDVHMMSDMRRRDSVCLRFGDEGSDYYNSIQLADIPHGRMCYDFAREPLTKLLTEKGIEHGNKYYEVDIWTSARPSPDHEESGTKEEVIDTLAGYVSNQAYGGYDQILDYGVKVNGEALKGEEFEKFKSEVEDRKVYNDITERGFFLGKKKLKEIALGLLSGVPVHWYSSGYSAEQMRIIRKAMEDDLPWQGILNPDLNAIEMYEELRRLQAQG
jgi:hypothetical protein